MKTINFSLIHHYGDTIFEDKLFSHIHFSKLLTMYDANFIQFKRMPTRDEFVQASEYLKEFHLKRNQKHIKFYLPENEKPTKDLIEYFTFHDYDFGHLELYAVKPSDFPTVIGSKDIQIVPVTDENFSDFLQLQFEFDMEFGYEFAKGKQAIHLQNFNDEKFVQVIAYYQGKPAGSVHIIIGEKTLEIDNLVVKEEFQRKGIGTRLQQSVMQFNPHKTVILVADGDDTPKEMYKKQNYQYVAFKYEILKLLTNE